jgi:hypothetical protein
LIQRLGQRTFSNHRNRYEATRRVEFSWPNHRIGVWEQNDLLVVGADNVGGGGAALEAAPLNELRWWASR